MRVSNTPASTRGRHLSWMEVLASGKTSPTGIICGVPCYVPEKEKGTCVNFPDVITVEGQL